MANMSILISTFGQRPRDQTSLPLVQYYFLPNVAMVIKMRMKDHPCASLYRVPGYLMVYSLSSLVHTVGISWYFPAWSLSSQYELFAMHMTTCASFSPAIAFP
ncbi:hypothetical protein VPH35_060471 [Triticum aestivum]